VIGNELTLILPTKNHEKFIKERFNELEVFLNNNFKNFEILIISNGSDTKNTQLINNITSSRIKHLIYTKSGKGFAVRKGLQNAKFKNVLICDSDFSVEISNLKYFFKNQLPISDFVIGSRKLNDSKVLNTPIIRTLSGSAFTMLTKYFLNLNYSDTQCGFKLINLEKFSLASSFKSNDFFYDVELLLLAKELRIETTEIPVIYKHNPDSSVKLIVDSFAMFFKILSFKFFNR